MMPSGRFCCFVFALFFVSLVKGQFTEDFSDGDFTSNPVWAGDVASFVIDGGQLRSKGPAASAVLHLSTESQAINGAAWEFLLRLDFAPSAANQARVYLVSDQSDLEAPLNGYFVEIGQSGADQIKLYRQEGSAVTLLFEGTTLFSSNVQVRIRVTRDGEGLWEVYSDPTGGRAFALEGTAFSDITHLFSAYFGVWAKHTSTRNELFYFDDITVTGGPFQDITPPEVDTLEVLSDTTICLFFNEAIEKITAETLTHYQIDPAVSVLAAKADDSDASKVILTTSSLINGQSYVLTLNGLKDLNENTIATDTKITFRYRVFEDATFGDVVINEFMADPTPATFLPPADFVELYNRSNKYLNTDGWRIGDEAGVSEAMEYYEWAPGTYLIVSTSNAATAYAAFGDAVGVAGFPNLNVTSDALFIRDAKDALMASVAYSAAIIEDAVSAELINPNDPCITETSYRLSESNMGATPGSQNSVFDEAGDTAPPVIISYEYDTSLKIYFSEKMDENSLTDMENYVSDFFTIDHFLISETYPQSIEIFFNEAAEPGSLYALMIAGLLDCWGNEIAPTTLRWGLGRKPLFNELVITEIMYDPAPAVGLPEEEYIEIYNTTNHLITTEGLMLTDATSTAPLPVELLAPFSYYTLTRASAAEAFSGNVLSMPNFPSLNNAGELLSLSLEDTLIFSIDYSPAWQDADKTAGGYALEMADVSHPCIERGINWQSSLHPSGGTPGAENSIVETIPDHFGAKITNVLAVSPDTIRIDLSEKINPSSIPDTEVYFVPSFGVQEVIFEMRKPQTIFIVLTDRLPSNEKIAVSLKKLEDCAGNEVDGGGFYFALPLKPEMNEIKLSEILFNPRSGGVDFVELYNDSDKYLTLKNWQLARLKDEGVADEKYISQDQYVIEPYAFLALTESIQVLLDEYPRAATPRLLELPALPPYNDDTGTVILLNDTGEVVTQFTYTEAMHYDLLEDNEGVSLERLSYSEAVDNTSNWRSASSLVGFATPGYANSQSFSSLAQQGSLQVEPKVFVPGDANFGYTLISYQFQSAGQFANVTLYDQNGRKVKTLANGALLATSGFMRWDGITDGGTVAQMGYYVIVFETYDASGSTHIFRETVVVGRDF